MKCPCIRNLDRFKRKGCPEKSWDGQEGCPCWIERVAITRGGEKSVIKQCVDLWMFKLHWDMCGLLEGNQQAVEGFRNAMCEPDPDDPFSSNKAHPKSDPAVVELLQLFERLADKQRIIFEHETRKTLEASSNTQTEVDGS